MAKQQGFSGIRFSAIALASVLVILSVFFTALMTWDGISRRRIAENKKTLYDASQSAGTQFATFLTGVHQDMSIIAGAPAVSTFIHSRILAAEGAAPEESAQLSQDRVVRLLADVMNVTPSYAAIRIVGLDDDGREWLRAARTGSAIAVTSGVRPRNGAPDLRQFASLRQGEIGFSDAVPADEQDNPAAPRRPVIYAVMPLDDLTGRRAAALIFTVRTGAVFAALSKEAAIHARFFLADEHDAFLVHPDPGKTYAFESGERWRLNDEFPQLARAFPPGAPMSGSATLDDASGRKFVIGVHELMLDGSGPHRSLRFIHAVSYRDLVISSMDNWPMVIAGGLLAVVFSLPLAFMFANAFIRPLRQMRDTVDAYSPGKPLGHLPIGRRDEIGVFARILDRVIHDVESQRILLGREISEREKAVRALARSEALSRNMIETMFDGHLMSDSQGIIRSFNQAAELIFGYTRAEVLGKSISLLIPEPADSNHDKPDRPGCTTGMLGVRRQLTGLRRNGEIVPLEITVTALQNADGEYFGAVIRDLSESKAREKELLHMAAALENAADSIHILDRNGFIVYANRAWERLTGQLLADVLGKRPSNRNMMDLQGEALQSMIRSTQRGEPWTGTLCSKTAEGRTFEQEVTISPIRDATEQVTSYVVIGRDVTEKKALEAQLQRAQKLESIGQLAAGIAHEINTPTQYVGDNLRFLQDAFAETNALLGTLTAMNGGAVSAASLAAALSSVDLAFLREEIPKALEQSADGCRRISGIVKAMKEFSHPGQDKTPVDLNRAIASTITVATNEWRYVAEVQTDLDAQLPLVVCLPGEFNQVILNMLVNAAHAIGDVVGDGSRGKGTISITTRQQGDQAEIRISDTGTGIPPEVREKIFDPFFTTKQVGKGTGQGLAIAHDVIVNKHGGTIMLESQTGKGSTFIIRLPLGVENAAAKAA